MAAASHKPQGATKKRLMIFCNYYLPSNKGGGGIWTIVNLIERFCHRYDFFVVTRNHENRSDKQPFRTVESNAWNVVGAARVYYLAPERISIKTFESLIRQVSPDGILLNSVFSKPTITVLAARRFKGSVPMPVILAPCGELSKGALSLKRWKKVLFLKFAKALGLYSNINWKASSALESDEICRVFKTKTAPWVAPDLPPKVILPAFSGHTKRRKETAEAKFIYFSRIEPKKNLLRVLESFSQADLTGSISLIIAGPVEDKAYWRKCQAVIAKLPKTVMVDPIGPVTQTEGLKLLFSSHFMILPTLGENFGYVILESLAAGCPVMISDRTMWTHVSDRNAGWVLSLDNLPAWKQTIRQCVKMDNEQFGSMSHNARQIADEWLNDPDVEMATDKLLAEVIGV